MAAPTVLRYLALAWLAAFSLGGAGCDEATPSALFRGDQEGWGPVHRAAFEGDLQVLARLDLSAVASGVRTDAGDEPLHLAVRGGHLAAVEVLLARGASPNVANDRRTTPVAAAAALGRAKILPRLLAEGGRLLDPEVYTSREGVAPPRARTRDPLLLALQARHAEVVATVLKWAPGGLEGWLRPAPGLPEDLRESLEEVLLELPESFVAGIPERLREVRSGLRPEAVIKGLGKTLLLGDLIQAEYLARGVDIDTELEPGGETLLGALAGMDRKAIELFAVLITKVGPAQADADVDPSLDPIAARRHLEAQGSRERLGGPSPMITRYLDALEFVLSRGADPDKRYRKKPAVQSIGKAPTTSEVSAGDWMTPLEVAREAGNFLALSMMHRARRARSLSGR